MKRILKAAGLLVTLCLFTGAVHAQLSSDKAAPTAQQVADLKKKQVTGVQPSATNGFSSTPAMTPQQVETLAQRPAAVKPATEASKPVALPSQGDVKPVLTAEPATKPAEAKPLPPVSAQVTKS